MVESLEIRLNTNFCFAITAGGEVTTGSECPVFGHLAYKALPRTIYGL